MTKDQIKSLKHGDRLIAVNGKDRYEVSIEKRFVSNSSSKKMALFVVFDHPRVPIKVSDYLKFYGTLEYIKPETQND